MTVWIVFEYADFTNEIIGVYKEKEQAEKVHKEFPKWRYIEEHEVQ